MASRLARVLAALALGVVAAATPAKVRTKAIEYRQGDTALQGYLAWDDAAEGRRPGILVIHEWWGHNQHARAQAERLAKAGYVGFALDMYGKGKVATHPKDAMAFMQEATKDPAVLAARFDAALALMKSQKQVDPERVGAFGYCFGGGVALNMSRAGRDLDAVVTFHGSLKPAGAPAEKGKVKPAILVLTGGADSMVPEEFVRAFEKEMEDAGVNARVITYPGAKHAFTNPDADKVGMESLAYDAKADAESWAEAMTFLKQVFGR